MGYYTNFELTHDSDTIDDEVLAKELTEVSGYDWEDDLYLGEAKWYDWQKHMKSVSKMHPDTLFTLEGEGEEHGDMWIAFFKSGKMQMEKAKITFGDFDETKLK